MFYLFDFDGTLADSMEFWSGIHKKALLDNGIPIPEGFTETITPLGNYYGAEYTVSLGLPISLDQYLNEVYSALTEGYKSHITLKPNVKEALIRLKKEGHSLNVLTASPHSYVDPFLDRMGIFNLFDNIWTIDDFSLTKADPTIYKKAAERLSADASDCIMVDDNITAILTAKSAGLGTVAVYDTTSASSEEKLKMIADRYITDFSEFLS